jgi:hypothetical protein
MLIPATPSNRAFVEAVNRRLARAGRGDAARAFLVRAAGWSVLLAGTGIALGAFTVALAIARSPKPGADAIAAALIRGLVETPVKVTGEVRLAEAATVTLAPQAGVSLADGAGVEVRGKVDVDVLPRPTPEILAGGRAASDASVVTNFTIFKSVPFKGGTVVTGWRFGSSEERLPSAQYCYFTQDLGDTDTAVRIALAFDGVPNPKATPRKGFDPALARQSCIWFQTNGATP